MINSISLKKIWGLINMIRIRMKKLNTKEERKKLMNNFVALNKILIL